MRRVLLAASLLTASASTTAQQAPIPPIIRDYQGNKTTATAVVCIRDPNEVPVVFVPCPGTLGNPSSVQNTDSYQPGTIASATANAAYPITIANGYGTGRVVFTGLTASGAILIPEATADGSTYVTVPVYQAGSKVGLTSVVADGTYRFNASALRGFRFRVGTVGTGAISQVATLSVAAFDAPSPTLDTSGNATVNIAPTSTLSNVVQVTTIDRGGVVGTSAVTLMAANPARRGWSMQAQSGSAGCYVNGSTTATADFHSLFLPPNQYFEPDHHVTTGAISVICTAPSISVYAREW